MTCLAHELRPGRCHYVLVPANPGRGATYCGNNTEKHFDRNEDGRRYARYDTFCRLHSASIDEAEEDEG